MLPADEQIVAGLFDFAAMPLAVHVAPVRRTASSPHPALRPGKPLHFRGGAPC